MQKKSGKQINNRIKISNTLRKCLIILSIVVFAFGSGNLIKSLLSEKETMTESKELYKYTNKFSEDANINLKNNQFVSKEDIADGQTYLSDLISTIDLDMEYKYLDSDSKDITYNYKIEATMKSVYNNNKSNYDVLNKTEILKEQEDKTVSSKDLQINEKITVDYEKYHEIIKKFKHEMGISVESYLDIKLIVNTKTKVGIQTVENQYVSDYNITLGDKIALIEDKSEKEKSASIRNESESIKEVYIDVKGAIINTIIMVVGIILLYSILSKTEKLNTIKNEYKLELNRILKSCESKLVQIEDLKQIDIENATRVKDIYQLLRLSDEALVPIYCYIKEEPENEAYFIVTKYEKNYIYILK